MGVRRLRRSVHPGMRSSSRAPLGLDSNPRAPRAPQARPRRRSAPRSARTGTSGPWAARRASRPTRSATAATASSKRSSTSQSQSARFLSGIWRPGIWRDVRPSLEAPKAGGGANLSPDRRPPDAPACNHTPQSNLTLEPSPTPTAHITARRTRQGTTAISSSSRTATSAAASCPSPLPPQKSSLSGTDARYAPLATDSTRWCELEIAQGRIFVADTGALHKLGFQHRNFDERSLLGLNLYSVTE